MLEKVNKLANWQVVIVFIVIGLAVFAAGLNNQFLGDDSGQVVSNPVVHSLAHSKLFFDGGTFYHGHGIAPLGGVYYRPVAVLSYAVIYTLFGPRAFYFHLVQLALYMAGAFVLYLIFKRFFNRLLSLCLSLLFLVHPVNSQNVYAIANLQDVLYMLFGLLALLVLMRSRSAKSLVVATALLFLSLLSKETGVVFVFIGLLYLFLWHRKYLKTLAAMLVVPVVLYAALKAHAVGLNSNPNNAPIDGVGIGARLLTMPSIIAFFLAKLLWPAKLASGYYWVIRHGSFSWVVLPLAIIALLSVAYWRSLKLVRARVPKDTYKAYLFFPAWVVVGIALHLQIIPLDMTASETWFFVPVAGVLGMIGVWLVVFQKRIDPRVFVGVFAVVFLILVARSIDRAGNWQSQSVLATHDITASKEDFNAYDTILDRAMGQGNYTAAASLAEQSIGIYPTLPNYLNLGAIQITLGNYAQADAAYRSALRFHSEQQVIMQYRAGLTLFYGSYAADKQLITGEINQYPNDATLWTYLAILQHRYGDNADAQAALTRAAKYAPVSSYVYNGIFNGQPFTVSLFNKTADVY